jgi:plastocyanin
MPFIMGALTFFLPCGFTITVQSLALVSGNPWQGAFIMGLFALGTAPMLLAIGLSSVAFFEKPHLSLTFSKVAGFLVLFFASFTIYNQATVLGFFNQNQVAPYAVLQVPIVDGKQVIAMTASAGKDNPDYFLVKAGTPVRWKITAQGQLGCNGAIVSRGLFDGLVYLRPGETTVKEFTPQIAGKYRFSCTMGMVSGGKLIRWKKQS